MSIAEKLTTIAENEQRVYEAGKQAEYDAFWNNFQDNGNREDYNSGFASIGWTDESLNPKHIVKPKDATMLFYKAQISFDPFSHPKFDFSKCDIFTQLISYTNITKLGTIDVTKTKSNAARFLFHYAQKLVTVEKLIVGATPENANYFQNCFAGATALENITFEGEIYYDIDMSPCTKLTAESLTSAVLSLATNPGEMRHNATFSKVAVNKAFETEPGANNGQYSNYWSMYVGQRANWNIALV